jgi:predicted ATPase
VLHGLYTHYHARAEHRVAYELAEQLFALAQEAQDPAFMLMAYQALGQSQIEMGDFVTGRDTLERGLAFHDPDQHRALAYLYGEEDGVSCRLNLMLSLFALGYPDQALARAREALALAEALGHPHVLAYTLYWLSTAHLLVRDSQSALAVAERALALCCEKGIPFWQNAAIINRGYALAMQGHSEEGIAEASQGLSAYRSIGAGVLQTNYLAQLAEMHLWAGQMDGGLALVDEGLAAVSKTGERCSEATLYRLRAELLRVQGHDAQAEADLQQALAVARAQQARSWELAATLSLCRMWRAQGRQDEARRMLADIYGWFTEGFDTPDLKEAKTLLDELRA